ncbi:MAG: hypothetical protein JO011_17250 [Ktedonobacteraceae bacterium]|nr:hypothetical protein [Ktedonobacteraceae bacterium]MBV9712653.1 hypothetical protein [Ktedonobacteraceae bacterium]
MPEYLRQWYRQSWLTLLGMTFVLLVSCSGNTGGQQPGATATSVTVSATPTATATPAGNWASLKNKPLHLPTLAPGAACPVTPARQHVVPDHQYAIGRSPVYLVNEAQVNRIVFLDAGGSDPGSSWKISKVFWEVDASYAGSALIRGRQIDGTHEMGFNGGLGQTTTNPQGTEPILPELYLQGDPRGQWKTYLTFVRIRASGCYAFQIDSQASSETIVIQATTG